MSEYIDSSSVYHYKETIKPVENGCETRQPSEDKPFIDAMPECAKVRYILYTLQFTAIKQNEKLVSGNVYIIYKYNIYSRINYNVIIY